MIENEDTTPAGLYVLFARGQRPRREEVLRALEAMPLASVSHDPADITNEAEDDVAYASGKGGHWLEIMLSGLTFDLLGLAPGPRIQTPKVAHTMGCAKDFDVEETEAIALFPGPHLADGATSLPIMRAKVEMGCALARRLDGAKTICWSPARTAIDTGMFCRSVDGWLSGGAFPALGLTAFAPDQSGDFVSEGLTYLVGQELRFDRELAADRVATTKLGIRLVHEIVGTGRVKEKREFTNEKGERFLLTPAEQAPIIEVTRM